MNSGPPVDQRPPWSSRWLLRLGARRAAEGEEDEETPMGIPTWMIWGYPHTLRYGSKYLLRKCLGYDLGGLAPSQEVFGSIGLYNFMG